MADGARVFRVTVSHTRQSKEHIFLETAHRRIVLEAKRLARLLPLRSDQMSTMNEENCANPTANVNFTISRVTKHRPNRSKFYVSGEGASSADCESGHSDCLVAGLTRIL